MTTPAASAPSPALDGTRVLGLPDHLLVHQLYLGCLSQASYLVGDARTGRAVAVDPRRDTAELLALADAEGLTIELVVETHLHADFLSGHLELADATGAEIGFGRAAVTEFPSRALAEGDEIDLGGVRLRVLETPGHTPESVSLVVLPDADAEPVAVLTGDTLFIGDVGRPDLLVAADIPAEDLAARLHESLGRLMALPDATLVLPAHGAGSACGKSLSTETVSTIGEQRRTNHAVQPMAVERFVDLVTEGQPTAPAYFGHDAQLNRSDRPLLDEGATLEVLDLAGLDAAVAAGAAVVDVRSTTDVAPGHLAGSFLVSLDGRFAEQVGTVVPFGRSIVLVGDPDATAEATIRLARIGFDAVVGALHDIEAVLLANPERSARLSRLTATAFAERRTALGDRLQVIDVRNPSEVEAAPVDGTRNVPLASLRNALPTLDRTAPVVLLCAGGARSAIASSLLRAEGFADVSDVLGGANALGVAAACSTRPAP